eukprot:CAMPEP_0119348298 /NCGR_PEP_ID=MMETSP1333-20130426/108972_1 /TAXON_ID=418940 /ORGANISM="Scyphosphaera apsteinii, Strain RCC1455" /LENGTH=296 /DNA_ID=CAMNT_0007360877 /DNA_START=154 /DNA_END=1041 /DNA_ORIENTATION=-
MATPRKVMEQFTAFENMRKHGANWGDALMSMFQGKKMTQEQAALCVQANWRRFQAGMQYQRARGAAMSIQASYRGHAQREVNHEKAAAAARLQARLRGNFTRDVTDYELVDFRCAALLQAAWRGRMARQFVNRLKFQNQSRLKRTFSWGRNKKPVRSLRSAGSSSRPIGKLAMGSPAEVPAKGKPVKRASSFDRFSLRSSTKPKESASSSSQASSSSAAPSKQLLFILLSRGPHGLGLELDATNTIVNIVKGGAADVQGYFKIGDTIASVDGIPLRRRLLQDVMDANKSSYSFDVW